MQHRKCWSQSEWNQIQTFFFTKLTGSWQWAFFLFLKFFIILITIRNYFSLLRFPKYKQKPSKRILSVHLKLILNEKRKYQNILGFLQFNAKFNPTSIFLILFNMWKKIMLILCFKSNEKEIHVGVNNKRTAMWLFKKKRKQKHSIRVMY